jgi:hypothetical protein
MLPTSRVGFVVVDNADGLACDAPLNGIGMVAIGGQVVT